MKILELIPSILYNEGKSWLLYMFYFHKAVHSNITYYQQWMTKRNFSNKREYGIQTSEAFLLQCRQRNETADQCRTWNKEIWNSTYNTATKNNNNTHRASANKSDNQNKERDNRWEPIVQGKQEKPKQSNYWTNRDALFYCCWLNGIWIFVVLRFDTFVEVGCYPL